MARAGCSLRGDIPAAGDPAIRALFSEKKGAPPDRALERGWLPVLTAQPYRWVLCPPACPPADLPPPAHLLSPSPGVPRGLLPRPPPGVEVRRPPPSPGTVPGSLLALGLQPFISLPARLSSSLPSLHSLLLRIVCLSCPCGFFLIPNFGHSSFLLLPFCFLFIIFVVLC